MSQGLDSSLLYCYASLMALNAFVAFYHIQFRWNEATLHHIVKDSIVDAAFAVFFPALILLYSLFIFQDDLMAVKIRQQFFPPRVFERKARNYVSAKELNMFTTDFESLVLIHTGVGVFPSWASKSFSKLEYLQFATNASNFCDAAQAACPNAVMTAMLKREDICKGVLYRECSSESQGVGICFNEDMGRVQCTYSQATIDMREAEIAAGCRCDKVEEKWLGCA
ncbi:structural constituent of cell wall [Phytophthora ramorum]